MIINILLAIVTGAFVGYIFKAALLKKYKKRVLQLENEMLSNHSKILALEKKNAEMERDFNNRSVGEYKRVIL
jgi:hypothetical protein